MRISDWSSDVCSSDLLDETYCEVARRLLPDAEIICGSIFDPAVQDRLSKKSFDCAISNPPYGSKNVASGKGPRYSGGKCEYAVIDIASDLADYGVFLIPQARSEEHTSELQSLMRISSAVFCLNK